MSEEGIMDELNTGIEHKLWDTIHQTGEDLTPNVPDSSEIEEQVTTSRLISEAEEEEAGSIGAQNGSGSYDKGVSGDSAEEVAVAEGEGTAVGSRTTVDVSQTAASEEATAVHTCPGMASEVEGEVMQVVEEVSSVCTNEPCRHVAEDDKGMDTSSHEEGQEKMEEDEHSAEATAAKHMEDEDSAEVTEAK